MAVVLNRVHDAQVPSVALGIDQDNRCHFLVTIDDAAQARFTEYRQLMTTALNQDIVERREAEVILVNAGRVVGPCVGIGVAEAFNYYNATFLTPLYGADFIKLCRVLNIIGGIAVGYMEGERMATDYARDPDNFTNAHQKAALRRIWEREVNAIGTQVVEGVALLAVKDRALTNARGHRARSAIRNEVRQINQTLAYCAGRLQNINALAANLFR